MEVVSSICLSHSYSPFLRQSIIEALHGQHIHKYDILSVEVSSESMARLKAMNAIAGIMIHTI